MIKILWGTVIILAIGCGNSGATGNGDHSDPTDETDTGTTHDNQTDDADSTDDTDSEAHTDNPTDTGPDTTDTEDNTGETDDSDTVCVNCESTDSQDITGDDMDDDGVTDASDNCPGVSNPDQYDQDADGVGDDCDNCPEFGNASQADEDHDGEGDACQGIQAADPDNDGVSLGDNCSLIPNEDQADGDADGVGDACDNCPETANPFQEDLDTNGIGDRCEEILEIPLGTPICASGSTESVRLASNLYLLLDLSTSMTWEAEDSTDTRWEVVTAALDGVSDELAAGFNVGLGTFPARCDDQSGSYRCDDTPSACSEARLPDSILPMQAGREGAVIRNAYADIVPFGTTPTATALEQVLENRVFEMTDDPFAAQRTSAVVLITDGDPNSGGGTCNTRGDMANTVTAAEALAEAGIPVYIIGLSGVNENNMETIAVAGGGENPNDPERTWFEAEDVESLSEALMVIAGASIGCTLSVAPKTDTSPDWERASVVMTLSDDEKRFLAADEYSISAGTPTTMTLAGNACDELQSSAGAGNEAGIEIRVACAYECGDKEICGDGIDNNCNNLIDEDCGVFCLCVTGEEVCGGDCPEVCIPAEEVCDGKDNDCDDIVDEGCCIPTEEICDDDIDNDCDGLIDEGCQIFVE